MSELKGFISFEQPFNVALLCAHLHYL